MSNCVLCRDDGGQVLVRTDLFRIILVNDINYPGYLRIILNSHVKELTDLAHDDSLKVYEALLCCEQAMRDIMHVDKVNVASLGNVVPHLHWHIIPRYSGDLHFPNPIWGEVTNSSYVPSNNVVECSQNLASAIVKIFTTK